MPVTKTAGSQLERIKKNINNAYMYFKPNYDRFHRFQKFVFDTSLSDEQKNVLVGQDKPVIECNIGEAYVSRLLGEFSKHEPSIEATPADGIPVDHDTIEVVEGHIRHIVYDANKNSCSYKVYKDLLTGGFSVIKVWTEYASPMSFNQVIKIGRVFDPTLCGFDPMAQESHKADGDFCFESYPRRKEQFEQEYPGVSTDNVSFTRKIEGYNWSYQNRDEDILLLADYYEKKRKKAKIVKLANGRVMTDKNYQKYEAWWQSEGFIEQIPVVVGKPRTTDLEIICRYVLMETEIIEYTETDFTYLPHVFVDGNSVLIKNSSDNEIQQMTRPYLYHTVGIQQLKNYAMQSLANEMENLIQHKFMIPKEGLPQEEEYLEAYRNIQKADTLVYQAYSENEPDKQIPAPREIQRVPIPPELAATFAMADQTTQVILGSYDAALGINDNQLSGVALIEAATQSNAAAMPYVTGYLQGWTQMANIVVDLMPKYYVTPRTIPVVGMDGKRDYKKINEGKKRTFDYEENALNVNVEAGVNFQIQKNRALMQIVALMQASPQFAEFMNTQGLPILVKNLTVYGADELQEMVPEWQKQQEQMKAKQEQMQAQMMQNNPQLLKAKADMAKTQQQGQIEMEKLQQQAKQNEFDNQIAIAEISIDKQRADSESISVQQEATQAQVNSAVQLEKAQTEKEVHALDAAAQIARINHDHKMDSHDSIRKSVDLQHKINELGVLKD